MSEAKSISSAVQKDACKREECQLRTSYTPLAESHWKSRLCLLVKHPYIGMLDGEEHKPLRVWLEHRFE